MQGILIVDKPMDWTSFDVVAKLRGVLGTRKLGHSGTLDPMATGVLPVFCGGASKAVDLQLDHDKAYRAVLRLGQRTDTGDITGTVLETAPVTAGERELRAVLPQFVGKQMQVPPMYSAVKINGQPLYKMARQGVEVERKARPIEILSIQYEGSPAEHPLFKEGCFHVEGQASQLAALCVEAKPGDTVIDLCAAPGGKTLLLAEEMQGQGALYSCDVAEHRVGLIRSAVERMGFAHVTALCNDATRPNPKLPAADRILVDAPCSGLGILAKKPDIRYKTLEKARHDELLATQSSILDTAAALLKAGGRLVYSTCTIDPAENEEQVAAFLARHPEFRVVRPAVAFPDGMTVGEHGALSVPTRTGMDGFFLCAMQKTQ